jgi:hypothetical protein
VRRRRPKKQMVMGWSGLRSEGRVSTETIDRLREVIRKELSPVEGLVEHICR